jgi:hypothetical protein
MNPYFRYIAMIGAALVLGIGIYVAGQTKPDDSKIFMGVGGDPRMRLCDSPANAELAQPDILGKLNINAPLVRGEDNKAVYRVSVLRGLGQESVSITFKTPNAGANTVAIARWANGALSQAQAELDVPTAAALIFAFKEAKIWDEVKPTMETLARAGGASAVIEVQAPNVQRCVATRYDDERVRPLLAQLVRRIDPLVAPQSIAGILSTDPNVLGSAQTGTIQQGQ